MRGIGAPALLPQVFAPLARPHHGHIRVVKAPFKALRRPLIQSLVEIGESPSTLRGHQTAGNTYSRVHEIASSSLVTRASPQPLTLYLLVRAIKIGAWVAQKVF